jgi:hypothetical protein
MPSPEGGPGCYHPEEGAVGVGELEKGGDRQVRTEWGRRTKTPAALYISRSGNTTLYTCEFTSMLGMDCMWIGLVYGTQSRGTSPTLLRYVALQRFQELEVSCPRNPLSPLPPLMTFRSYPRGFSQGVTTRSKQYTILAPPTLPAFLRTNTLLTPV